MPAKTSSDRKLKLAVFIIIAFMGIIQVAVCRGMYADGPNMLIGILQTQDFALFEIHRIYYGILSQLPTVMAIKAGVTNLVFLRYAYSSTMLLLPLLFWMLTLVEARNDFLFWPFVMLFTFIYYNVGFMTISEFNISFALTACCLACLLRKESPARFDRWLLFVAAALYPLEYASTMFIGVPLLALAALKWRAEKDPQLKKYWLLIGFFFLASIASGIWETLTPRDPVNFRDAKNTTSITHDYMFWITLLYAGVAGLGLFMRSVRATAVILVLCLLLLLATTVSLVLWGPFFAYGIRMFMSMAFFGCCLYIIFVSRYARPIFEKPEGKNTPSFTLRFVLPTFTLFALLAMHDVYLSLKFAEYLDRFSAAVNSHTGLLPYEESSMQFESSENLFFWVWTHPTLSLVMRNSTHSAIMLNPSWYHWYQGFEPTQAIPDLSRYYGEESPTSK